MLERRLASLDFFFFNDTATTEIYPLSLHDALPIYLSSATHDFATRLAMPFSTADASNPVSVMTAAAASIDRKSTRLNSSHANISYAVFCLKKKNRPRHRADRFSPSGYPTLRRQRHL